MEIIKKTDKMIITTDTLIKDYIDKKIFSCPSCGRLWDINKHNVYQCGANIKNVSTREARMKDEKKIYCPLRPRGDGLCDKKKCRWWRIPGDCCVIEQIADIFFDIHLELELLRTRR